MGKKKKAAKKKPATKKAAKRGKEKKADAVNVGGRIPPNPRQANIAEGLAAQMFRPFSAIAQVPREEDHGIDLIATLLRKHEKSLVAEDSFVVQVKTYTAPFFKFRGDGVRWLRQLSLPYFPVVANLKTAEVQLFTLNSWHHVIYTTEVDRYCFVPTREHLEADRGDERFHLGDPLMEWSLLDCSDPEFPEWAYSILKPVIAIERGNQRCGPMSRFFRIEGGPYYFKDRGKDGLAAKPPRIGSVENACPGNPEPILNSLLDAITPFANLMTQIPSDENPSTHLVELRKTFRLLGFNPDPDGLWDGFMEDIAEYYNADGTAKPRV